MHKLTYEELERELAEFKKQVEILQLKIENQNIENEKRASELITAKKKSEENEKRFKQLFDNAPLSYQSLDVNSCIIDANPTWLKTLGYVDKKEVIGRPFGDFMTKESAALLKDRFSNFIKNGEIHNHEFEMLRKNGAIITVSYEGKIGYDDLGQFHHTHCIFNDITKSKSLENKLKEANQFNQQIINSAREGIIVYDKDLKYQVWNPFMEKITGIQSETILGKHPLDFFPFLEEKDIIHLLQKALKGITSRSNELSFELPENMGKRWTSDTISPLFNSKGEIIGAISIVRDVTESKQFELELIKSKEKTEDSERIFRNLFENSLIAKSITKIDGTLEVNKSYSDILGYSKEELKNKKWQEITYPADINKSNDYIESLMRGESEEIRFEKRYLHKNGSVIYAEVSILLQRDRDNKPQYFITSFNNVTKRKQAEKERKQFLNFFKLSPEIMVITEPTGAFLAVNPSVSRLLGYSEEELISNPFIDFVHPDDVEKTINEARRTDDAYTLNFENRYKKKDGSYIVLSWSSYFNKEEGITYATARDITNERFIENALDKAKVKAEESEGNYRKLVETMPDGVYRSTHDGKFVSVNPAMVKMLGYGSKEELLAVDIKNDLYIEEGDRDDVTLNELQQELGVFKLRKKEGTIIWVEDHGWYSFNELGEITYHEGIIRDVTERMQKEQELIKAKEYAEESEKQIKYSQKVAKIGYYKLDLVTGIWTSSEMLDNIFGIDESYIRNFEGWTALVAPEYADDMSDYYNNILINKEKFNKDYKIINQKTHKEIWVHGLGEFKFDSLGNLIEMFGTIQDVSNKKYIEIELIKAKEKAEESDKLKSAFLANMSHEIRTPMNGILGFSELLKTPELTGEKQQKYISIIEKSGKRMLNIINDIVNISKIESGLMNIHIEQSNFNEQVAFIYTFFKPEVEQKGIEFLMHNEIALDDAIIYTDREKVYAILTNLVKNAIKYTESGTIEIGYFIKEDFLQFYVKDTGIGVPENRQEAIFERFIQAEVSNKMAKQGAGLGLSISKAYVTMLGGKLWVESNDKNSKKEDVGGSTFYFTLPYCTSNCSNKGVKTEVPIMIEENSNKKIKILIAEDDESSEILLSIAVESFAKEIIIAKNGLEAVEACRNNTDIDLIFMDIQMPEMDGYEATKQIRKFNKTVYIIAQTAFALEGDKEKVLAAGCSDYITKPLKVDKIKKLISSYLVLNE